MKIRVKRRCWRNLSYRCCGENPVWEKKHKSGRNCKPYQHKRLRSEVGFELASTEVKGEDESLISVNAPPSFNQNTWRKISIVIVSLVKQTILEAYVLAVFTNRFVKNLIVVLFVWGCLFLSMRYNAIYKLSTFTYTLRKNYFS